MKRIAIIAWLAAFASIVKLYAEVKVIEGMPYVENNGVRLYVDVGKKHSIEIADTPPPKSQGEWWTVRAYIQNAGKESVSILLGHETDVLVGFPDNTSVNVSYQILSEATVGDVAVKPPVGDFRLVVLEPGEVAQLPVANVQLKEQGKVKKMKISYAVDRDFAKWFKVWSGEIELILDKDRPPGK